MNRTKRKWGNSIPHDEDWITINGDICLKEELKSIGFTIDHDDVKPIPFTGDVINCIADLDRDRYPYRLEPINIISIEFYDHGQVFINSGIHYVSLSDVMDCPIYLHHIQQIFRVFSGRELKIDWTIYEKF